MITRKSIDAYRSLEAKRLRLNREAKQLEKQAEEIEAQWMEEVRERGGETRTLKTCGHIFAIKTKPNSVQWKPEFIRVASMAEAEKIIQAAGMKEVFSLEPA